MQRLLALNQVGHCDVGIHQLSANTQVHGAVVVITELCAVVGNPRHTDGAPLCRGKYENVIEVLASVTPRLRLHIRWKEYRKITIAPIVRIRDLKDCMITFAPVVFSLAV